MPATRCAAGGSLRRCPQPGAPPGLTFRLASPCNWPAYTPRRRDPPGPRAPRPGGAVSCPRCPAGDFNATLDHAQFRRLLSRGYLDAASQAGNGLSFTWGPRPGRRPTLLTIDHVLVDRRCAVLTTSAHWLPGSDHRALYAELRLPLILAHRG